MVVNDAGVIGLTLNGKSFPATAPLVVNQGDWVAVNYYNEGLMAHPMHLHSFPQLVYAKDGIPLDEPYFADTINIAPGERYSVLFQATDPGTWVWHCHILTHVECGGRHVRHGHGSGRQPGRVDAGPWGYRVRDAERSDKPAAGLHTGGRHERTDRTPRRCQLRP